MTIENPEKKKIVFVIPFLAEGGTELIVVNLINFLSERKYEKWLVLFESKLDYKEKITSSVKIISLRKKTRWDFFKLIWRLRGIIKTLEPEIVVSFLFYANIITVLAKILSFFRQFKVIICEHSYTPIYLPKSRFAVIKKFLLKFTYSKADLIIVVSDSIKKALVTIFHIPESKIKRIYNPFYLEEIERLAKKDIKLDIFYEKNKILISIGRLIYSKRFDRLLRVFTEIKKKMRNVYLIILGKGKLEKELQSLAEELNIDKFVYFVGFQKNPYVWLSKADVFVLTSDYEGLPNVIIEAMACGVPVVSTDCPSGPNEIITNGKNGILVPPGDEKALAEAIMKVLQDDNLRSKLIEEGRKRAQDFDIHKILPQYEKLF